MGLGMSIFRNFIKMLILMLVTTAIILYAQPRLNLDFWTLWATLTVIGLVLSIILWVLIPDRDKVNFRRSGR